MPESFHQLLVLNKWLLKKFHGGTFAALKERLANPIWEGKRHNGNSAYFDQLTNFLVDEANSISKDRLEIYDLNILKFWDEITYHRNKKEGTELKLKYFQYLSLLFTEIYLDWYFNQRELLIEGLNEAVKAFPFQPYTEGDLNKIAFWNATGSGKTLLLHVNIKQYLHYYQAKNGRGSSPDKIILLTPNEGLSRQHLEELDLSGIASTLFSKSSRPFPGTVEIIDVNKLGDEMGDKVVAVDAFEGKNLVMVDEGHRGTSGGGDSTAWLRRRDALCRTGFSFEYSATFGQAVNQGNTVAETELELRKKKLLWTTACRTQTDFKAKFPLLTFNTEVKAIVLDQSDKDAARFASPKEVYAKCVLFDYSYKFFYEDGYGKESLILNLTQQFEASHRNEYLVAALLAFYQQRWIFDKSPQDVATFSIEPPLWIFVGNTVSDDQSDVMTVLRFFAWVTAQANKARVERTIVQLIQNESLLTDVGGRNVFNDRFAPLFGQDTSTTYLDIFSRVFQASAVQNFRVVRFKGVSDELGLRIGDAPFFGVVNVGDAAGVFNACKDDPNIQTEESEQTDSLFASINRKESKINLLIGSRKFTEGWSSWRVSSMGLLNMGRAEGTQIIQLFGRGVRLKGRDYSLKRSTSQDRPKASRLPLLETLNIFGIKADYISSFKDYLKEEGISIGDEILEISFPTIKNVGNGKLTTLKLKKGYQANQVNGFKRKVFPVLYEVPTDYRGKVKPAHAELDLYPKIQVVNAPKGTISPDVPSGKKANVIATNAFAFFDWDRIYLRLMEYKNQKSWFNLRVTKNGLRDFVEGGSSWYTLWAPDEKVQFQGFASVKALEEVLVRLLFSYTERFYESLKGAYEDKYFEYSTLTDDDGSYIDGYTFAVQVNEPGGQGYCNQLLELKNLVESGRLGQASLWRAGQMEAIVFQNHLFNPLVYFPATVPIPLTMKPLALGAPSEVTFVKNLKIFYDSPEGQGLFAGRDIYLMRNASHRSNGVGFASAGNFYPDFLLWVIDGNKQYLSFIDPKGILHLDLDSAKFQLYKTIKEIEDRLANPQVVLNAFILSETYFDAILNKGDKSKEEFEAAHILFMKEDGPSEYLRKMFGRIFKNILSQ